MEVARVSARGSDAAEAAIRPFFPGVTFGAAGTRHSMSFDLHAYAAHGTVLLDYTIEGPRIRAATDMPGFTVSETSGDGVMSDGRATMDTLGKPTAVPHHGLTAVMEHVHARAIQLDADALRNFVRTDLGNDDFVLRSTGTAAVSPRAGAVWMAAAQFTEDRMLDGSADVALIGAGLTSMLLSTYLACFPTTWTDARRPTHEPVAGSAAVRRAAAFIEENRHLPIDVAEIARAARLSIRGLHAAFRRERGMTPMQFLRLARLDAARHDLLAADPTDGTTVASIARAWGFVQLGRFARTYREAYGETPRTTLRR